jgi:phosphocarrier protein FPr
LKWAEATSSSWWLKDRTRNKPWKNSGKLIADGLGDEGCKPAPAPATTTIAKIAEPPPRPRSADPNVLLGVAASPGLAVGNVFQVKREDIAVEEEGHGVEQEKQRLADAVSRARGQLEALRAQLHAKADPAKAAIFAAHAELLDDPDFLDIATSAVAKGKSAAFAWKNAAKLHAERLASLRNELLAQRANDVRDVGWRVLELLTGVVRRTVTYPEGSILIAEDLTPSDTATMDRGRVVGFATVRGGATSHVAILARALDIPALAGIEPAALDIANGTPVVLDTSQGSLRLHPPAAEIERIRQRQARHETRRREDIAHAQEPAVTIDGRQIEVFANIGGLKDAGRSSKSEGKASVCCVRSSFSWTVPLRRPKTNRPKATPRSSARSALTAPSSSARSMSVATSRCPTCRSLAKTILSSASAASGSDSTGLKSCAPSFARCSVPRPRASCS